jgi:mannose-6-phosphate isomerase class I
LFQFQKYPFIEIKTNSKIYLGWEEILSQLLSFSKKINKDKKIIIVELYQGVLEDEIVKEFSKQIKPELLITANSLYFNQEEIKKMIQSDITNDRIFGYMTRLEIDAFFDPEKVNRARSNISSLPKGTVLILGTGASHVSSDYDVLIYADMARWEIQQRMRKHEVNNLGVNNKDTEDWSLLYKQGYFVDWRVCDRLKKKLMNKWDYILDTNDRNIPKLVEGKVIRDGLEQCLNRPFSVVPFFDPGPWGGQWMKDICDLDKSVDNYAWCFNCVPEENSLLFKIGEQVVEIPSINLIFFNPQKLLGEAVHARFGDEFPIRFDFLDTMDGGNLSLQVHPLTEYIQEKFGMHYTQDESYYIMDAEEDSVVYLGLKENINSSKMIEELEEAQEDGRPFDAEKHVQTWQVKKHDHFLIPAGTVHCSGKDSVVLEISATPYIFTFKLWDWGRLGLDGKPRPINIEHGKHVIQWNRTTFWTKENLVNQIEKIAEGDGWIEERTGLHEREFIETRRHWFTKKVYHNTDGGVNVLNLVDGEEIIIESPSNSFEPFIIHYAETFIVPACVGEYTIRPYGKSEGKKCATIKAFIRTKA